MSGWDGMLGALSSFTPPPPTVAFDPTSTDLFGSDSTPFTANVRLYLDSDGGVRGQDESAGSATTTDRGVWSSEHPDEEDGADYEVSISRDSGDDVYTGFQDEGTYYTLDSNLQYNFSLETEGTASAVYIITIRDVATQTTINTLTVNVDLELGGP